MKVKLVFHGSYREITGVREKYLELNENSTINDLLQKLELIYGKELTSQLIDYESDKTWSLMAIAVNGVIMNDVKKFAMSLKESDEIIFLPPALGG